jgi:predicted naringenin-chalcone synthase
MQESNNKQKAYLLGIGTAVPDYSYSQDYALEFNLGIEGTTERQKKFMRRIYAGSAIEKRYSVIADYDRDPADYCFFPPARSLKPEPTTEKRNDLFIQEANRLSLRAVEDLFKRIGNSNTDDITHLITVSCTGFSAPGFDFHLARELTLPPATRRYHIGFMGCYAALTAMSLAHSICKAEPDARVLMVNVELCSVHFQQRDDLDTMVANAIFADGASAALIVSDPTAANGPIIAFDSFNSQILPDSKEDMAWRVGNTGFTMKLSAYVPRIINENLDDILEGILKKSGRSRGDIDIWAVHPGGKAILEKIEEALQLDLEELRVSYEVLRNYGNMSSVTIMFVLQRILADSREGNVLAIAFGPGLTVETGFMRKTARP